MPPSLSLPRVIAILAFVLLGAPVAHSQDTAEQQAFQEAERYYAAGMAQKDSFERNRYMSYVIGLYNRYLDTYSGTKNEEVARFHLSYAHQSLGQIDTAKRNYRFLINRHRRGPYVGSAARQLAYLAFVEENWEEAATYFSVASRELTDESLRHTALTKEIECLLKLNRDAEVAAALQRILDSPSHPHRDWARFILAYQAFQADRYEDTIRILKPLIDDPEKKSAYYSQALFYTGLASAELGLEDAQDSHLRAILEMSVNDPSLTPEQRRGLATNKAKAQTSLMGLYSRRKDWDTVIRLYEKGDFGATGRTEAKRCMRAGEAYFIQRQYREARSCYRRVDRAVPETEMAFEASYQCLVCDYHLNNPGLVERIDIFFELYGKTFPDHPHLHAARFFKGESLFQRNDMEEAARALNKVDAEKLDPVLRRELLFKHGWALAESGQFDGAARCFTRLLADFPDSERRAEVLNKRAEAHLALGDHTSALRDFEAVLALDPEPLQKTFALQGSARVLRLEKEYEPMIARYRRLLADFPDLPRATVANANYRIGWGYHKIGKDLEASPYLRKARDLAPEFYSQPVGDLLILGAFNRRDEAALHTALQEVYRQAPARLIPRHMLSWLGVQLFHEGQIEDSTEYLERATDTEEPDSTEAGVWRILAKAQNRSGSYAGAEKTSLLLLEREEDPRWQADAYLDLAEARLGLQKYDEALAACRKGLELEVAGPHIAGLHLIRGEVALAQERWSEALSYFEKAIPMVPDDPLLQPRALDGGRKAALEDGQAVKARQFEQALKSRFPNWTASR